MSEQQWNQRPGGKAPSAFDGGSHTLMNEAEVDKKISEYVRAVDELHVAFQRYIDDDLGSSPQLTAIDLLNALHQDAESILAHMQQLPAETFMQNSEAARAYRTYILIVEALEPGLIQVIAAEFREMLDQFQFQNNTMPFSDLPSSLRLSSAERQLIDRVSQHAVDSERRDAVLRQLVEIQTSEAMSGEKIPMPLIDFAADVITEMEVVEFDYSTGMPMLERILETMNSEHGRLPEQLRITRSVTRALVVCVARLQSMSAELARPKVQELQKHHEAIAEEYADLRLGELEHLYTERVRFLQPLIELIALHKSFHAGRIVSEA